MLVHGVACSSDSFVINTADRSSAFILAREGFDVWLVNTRGNKYSNKHVRLDSQTDAEYWNNGVMSKIARYDIPAFIEHILETTGYKKVGVYAHSMGSQIMFYNFITNPTYYN